MDRIGRALACLALLLLGGHAAGTRAETVVYYHTDALGSPVAVTDVNRNVIERTQYAPYGDTINRPLHDGPGYTGHESDAATGLVYAQQRYYDPVLGRFLSADPVAADSGEGDNFNRYWYASDNPYKFIDPDGRKGKVAWLVELTANGLRKIARLTKEEAIRARSAGKNIVADRRQVAHQIESATHGTQGQLKHSAHELEDGSKGMPHYQTEGAQGHSFWGKISIAAAILAGYADKAAKAADYIPDPVPRPAEPDDIARTNSVINSIGTALGTKLPNVRMNSESGQFQGVFRVNGRIDSRKLEDNLRKK